MDFIEVHTVGGSELAIKKDFIVFFRDYTPIPQEIVKQHPFLKGIPRCTLIQLTSPGAVFFCSDTFSDIVEQLK